MTVKLLRCDEQYNKYLEFFEAESEMEHIHYVFKFENGYGASIVKCPGSYGYEEGLWELAVIKFVDDDYKLVYDTKITNDVLGHLTDGQVNEYLEIIKNLPSAK